MNLRRKPVVCLLAKPEAPRCFVLADPSHKNFTEMADKKIPVDTSILFFLIQKHSKNPRKKRFFNGNISTAFLNQFFFCWFYFVLTQENNSAVAKRQKNNLGVVPTVQGVCVQQRSCHSTKLDV